MEKIVVIGGGGHAKVIVSVLKNTKKYEIVGFTDKSPKQEILSIPYLGTDDILKDLFNSGVNNACIGIGQLKSSKIRKNIYHDLKNIGYNLPNIVSDYALVSEKVSLGEGIVIMNGVILESGCKIGNGSIVNTNSSLNHDSEIGSFTHIAPGVTICGNVDIGDEVLIGSGAVIIQGLKIVSKVIVSAGSNVTKSLIEPGLYGKNPLIKIK
tara:strand:+ start:473 stop:1102 length:630 start_codon:yes stop_codon:yes gene_type:complete